MELWVDVGLGAHGHEQGDELLLGNTGVVEVNFLMVVAAVLQGYEAAQYLVVIRQFWLFCSCAATFMTCAHVEESFRTTSSILPLHEAFAYF
jgi:hypothetical protein